MRVKESNLHPPLVFVFQSFSDSPTIAVDFATLCIYFLLIFCVLVAYVLCRHDNRSVARIFVGFKNVEIPRTIQIGIAWLVP